MSSGIQRRGNRWETKAALGFVLVTDIHILLFPRTVAKHQTLYRHCRIYFYRALTNFRVTLMRMRDSVVVISYH